MTCTYQTDQWLPYPIESVFAFFANPANLPALMPEWQKSRLEQVSLVSPVQSGSPIAGTGSRISLSFRPFPGSPFRLRWTAEITDFEYNSYFIDRQLRGPFSSWNHTHRLTSGPDAEGRPGTFIDDYVAYAPPMGILGRLANFLFLEKQLEQTFSYRHRRTAELLGGRLIRAGA
jgi:ligand-binding SRPBCC domain-containing protein